jgi:glycosyltransferase involved in cell wall biosynthesis
MARISVVIPSYNHEKFIAEAIQSVVDQTYQDFEIIIVDDGSTDGSIEQIRKFSDPRIKLILHKKNRGAAVAMRTALERAKGEYIAVLSSDDMFLPDKLEKQVKFLDENPQYGAVFSYVEIIDEHGHPFTNQNHTYYKKFEQQNRDRYQWLNHFFYHGNALCHPSVLIRKSCYDKIGLYDERFAQLPDFDFWVRFCLKYELYIIPEKLVKFRIRSDEKNASAGTKQNIVRFYNEWSLIAHHFLSIPSFTELKKIFPEMQLGAAKTDTSLIPFYIAKLALSSTNNALRKFGIDTLYQLFYRTDNAESIKKYLKLEYTDLYKISGEIDAFNVFSDWYSYIFVDSGSGYNDDEQEIVGINLAEKNFVLDFNLSKYPLIKSLRWDPIKNRLCDISITRISYKDSNAVWHNLDPEFLSSNAKKVEGTVFYFDTVDPFVFISIQTKLSSIRIEGSWNIYELPLRDLYSEFKSVKQAGCEKERELQNLTVHAHVLEETVTQKDHQIQEMDHQIQNLTVHAHALEETVTQKDHQIHEMDHHIQNLSSENKDVKQKISDIENSIVWQITTKFHQRVIERLFLQGTQRRVFYDSCIRRGKKIFIPRKEEQKINAEGNLQ